MAALTEPHMNDHILSFNDAHFMMALCGAKKFERAEELLECSRAAAAISGKNVNENVLRAILAYSREQYAQAVDYLHPIRYQVRRIIVSN